MGKLVKIKLANKILVALHTNHCTIRSTAGLLSYKRTEKEIGLVCFYGTSTIVGYLMVNLFSCV